MSSPPTSGTASTAQLYENEGLDCRIFSGKPWREQNTSSCRRAGEGTMNKLLDLQRLLHSLSETLLRVRSPNIGPREGLNNSDLWSRGIEGAFSATDTLVHIIYDLTQNGRAQPFCDPVMRSTLAESDDSKREAALRAVTTVGQRHGASHYSCYLRLLSVYELLVESLRSTVDESAHGTGRFPLLELRGDIHELPSRP